MPIVAHDEPCSLRKCGISPVTNYRWKSKLDGLAVSDAKRLKAPEDENRKLNGAGAGAVLRGQPLKKRNPGC
jgi:putative transposase